MSITVKSYLFVIIQFTLLVGIVLLPGRMTGNFWQTVSLVLVGFGLLVSFVSIWQLRKFSLTVLPTPLKNARLLDTGLYGLARHPIYSGLLMFMTGVVMARYSWLRLSLLCALYVVLYSKSSFEEEQLIHMFGKRYQSYQQKVRRFL